MGLLLTSLVIAGFGLTMIKEGRSPTDLPFLFHLHAVTYLAWFLLFIFQVKLIGERNYNLHKKLGYGSILVVIAMLITGFLVASASYARGRSPIPDTTIQQFMSFPIFDLLALFIFYCLGVLNRSNARFHKHCLLIATIAIMDPGIARLSLSLGVPPLTIFLHVGLVVLVMIHDWQKSRSIHVITWLGLAYVILRIIFIFTVATTEGWASLVDSIFS